MTSDSTFKRSPEIPHDYKAHLGLSGNLRELRRRDSSGQQWLQRIILVIFFASGFASLLYQVAWQRLLTINYGVGALSVALIVSVYMCGLGLGSWWGGVVAERVRRRVMLYCLIELGIGLFGIVSPLLLNFLQEATAGSNYMLSFVFIFLFLCVPTVLMGSTLPLLTKIYNALRGQFFETVSRLYFVNTIGAAFGAISASYVMITLFGIDRAVYTAAGLNFLLALVLFYISKSYRYEDRGSVYSVATATDTRGGNQLRRFVFGAVFLTGFIAVSYEIIWYRIVGVLIKDSAYAFSSILFVYLLGIGLGSYGINWLLGRYQVRDKTNLFCMLQTAIVIYVVTFFFLFALFNGRGLINTCIKSTFYSSILPVASVPHNSLEWFNFVSVLLWPAVFFFIPVLLMGASFPLISDIAYNGADNEGRTVGRVYFFNILGNVLGGIVTGFVLLPLMKTGITLVLLTVSGCLFLPFITRFGGRPIGKQLRFGLLGALAAACILFLPDGYTIYSGVHRRPDGFADVPPVISEGREGVVCTFMSTDSMACYINGSPHGRRPNPIFEYETIEALSCSKSPNRVLIIGLGAGTVLESTLKDPRVRKVTVVELNSVLIDNLQHYSLYQRMLSDPRIELIIEDGRRFLYRNAVPFDLILMDPLRTRTAYSNNIYSQEFFDLCRRNLSEQGVLMAWLDEYNVLPHTICSVFPHMRLYAFFALCSKNAFEPTELQRQQLLEGYSSAEQESLKKLEGAYLGDAEYVLRTKGGYPVNRDWRPVTEYYFHPKWTAK
jgi:spermidine synthase